MTMEHFDAIIVGSGFGGSVTAYRLAEAGRNVCVLERGKAFPPGSFPRSPEGMANNFWDPAAGKYGMYSVWSFRGLEGLVSSGLGGGSLIYANVMLRKDERWFVHDRDNGGYETWPITRAQLDPYYDRAEPMLGITSYPFDVAPYSSTPKTIAMRESAQARGLNWMLPPLAVTFGNPGDVPVPGEPIREAHPNLHGRTRLTCNLCGECDVGCNVGGKNTLDYNYLTEAKRAGADIRTLCEVKSFAPGPQGKGFLVTYVQHDLAREGEKLDTSTLPRTTVYTDKLILSAGTFGSTYLLLKNQAAFGGLSPLLGTRFCGNGDLLSFAVKAKETHNGVTQRRRLRPSFGPVITSAIRFPDELDGPDGQHPNGQTAGRGMYIEDAGYPAFMSWLVESSNPFGMAKRVAHFAWQRVKGTFSDSHDSDLSAEFSTLMGDCSLSSDSLPLLGMGRDTPDGVMRLDGEGYLDIDWTTRGSRAYFKRMRGEMEAIAKSWGARFFDNPLWYLKRVITVHPLGGCPMGKHEGEGVVNEFGEMFGVPGLYVADGSVMPGPVGPNPSLTIAALAERFSERMVE